MSYQKIFTVSITIINPTQFCADTDNNVLLELRRLYRGRCYMGCYITEINRLLNRSACRISTVDTSARGVIDVEFEATVYVIAKWDFITGVKITNTTGVIAGKKESNGLNIIVSLRNTKATEILKVDNKINVAVMMASHESMSNIISVSGILYHVTDANFECYHIKNKVTLNHSFKDKAFDIYGKIKVELALRTKLDAKKILFFEKLYYTYGLSMTDTMSDIGGWLGPKSVYDAATTNIMSMIAPCVENNESVTIASGYWYRPHELFLSSPFVVHNKSKPENAKILTEMDADTTFITMLMKIHRGLVMIRESVEDYSAEDIEKQSVLWQTLQSFQRK